MATKFSAIDGQITAADPLSGAYSVRIGRGKEFTVVGSGPELSLRVGSTVLGAIVRFSPCSGSVWAKGNCIGEYSLGNDGYEVVPIAKGFLEPTEVKRIHPVNFLIEKSYPLGRNLNRSMRQERTCGH